MKPCEIAYQPRLWEAMPTNPHPLAALATRQEAAALAALGGPGRCTCGQPASYFEVSTAPAWRCRACYEYYLQEVRTLCSIRR
jgi:hypothetical protein